MIACVSLRIDANSHEVNFSELKHKGIPKENVSKQFLERPLQGELYWGFDSIGYSYTLRGLRWTYGKMTPKGMNTNNIYERKGTTAKAKTKQKVIPWWPINNK